jgi:hypothetical protein
MTRIFLTLALALFTAAPAIAQTDDHGASQLNGDWTLDLRPTNDAPAYIKTMKLDITLQGVVAGDFYDHVIDDGRAFDAKGRACFAFHTSDNTGPYQTSGCRVGDRIEGQSWSEGRRFLLTWTATRSSAKGL